MGHEVEFEPGVVETLMCACRVQAVEPLGKAESRAGRNLQAVDVLDAFRNLLSKSARASPALQALTAEGAARRPEQGSGLP